MDPIKNWIKDNGELTLEPMADWIFGKVMNYEKLLRYEHPG